MVSDVASFDAVAEGEWQRLRQQIELAAGFWLGFVFTDAPRLAALLRQRVADLLKSRGSFVHWGVAHSPADVREMTAVILAVGAAVPPAGCIWIEAIDSEPPWRDAWAWFAARLNEHREPLRRQLPGGLMLVAPTAAKAIFHEVAPDLWSIRDLVVELPMRGEKISLIVQVPGLAADVDRSDEMELAARTLASLTTDAPPQVRAELQLKVADGLLAAGRAREAIDAASIAIAHLQGLEGSRTSRPARIMGLRTLGFAEWSDGDIAAARSHLSELANLTRQIRAAPRSATELQAITRDAATGITLLAGIEAQLGADGDAQTLRREAISLVEEATLSRDDRLVLTWVVLMPPISFEGLKVDRVELERALSIAEEMHRAAPDDPSSTITLGVSLWLCSRDDLSRGDVAGARSRLLVAQGLYEGLLSAAPHDLRAQLRLADTHRALYTVESVAGFPSAGSHRDAFVRLARSAIEELHGWPREQWQRLVDEVCELQVAAPTEAGSNRP